jgi:putative toxin-antitoxin system antitoxin component (TIGR02293 family)
MASEKSRQARGPRVKTGVLARGEGGVLLSKSKVTRGSSKSAFQEFPLRYKRKAGVTNFVARIHGAEPLQLIATERDSVFVKDLASELRIPSQRMFAILGVPKATAEKKIAAGELLAGSGGRAALGIARLLGMAQAMVDGSTAAAAADFDTGRWLGEWLERPQPALGGRKPAELVDTPTGLAVVTRLLGAIESGAYQ